MNDLVYPRERTLGAITFGLGLLLWIGLLAGTFGVALVFLAVGFVAYLFAQSALIARIKGNGVALSERQFPDLYTHFAACCDRLEMRERPNAYIINGNRVLNAFATRFLGRQYLVLNSDIVDAMGQHAEGVRFYIGHELGHLRMKHLTGHFLRWPVLWLPLLGAAYARAKESTCDRHGRACCSSPDSAVRALAVLSAGSQRWQTLDTSAYERQATEPPGFWMSFHELVSGYPWTAKRCARVLQPDAALPSRNPFAHVFALFVPYAGRLGAGAGFLIMVYIIGVMAAIAIPAYKSYQTRVRLSALVMQSKDTRDALASYYESNHQVPDSLARVGAPSSLADGSGLSLDSKRMLLTVHTPMGELVFVPKMDSTGHVVWKCTNGDKLQPTQLPAVCGADLR